MLLSVIALIEWRNTAHRMHRSCNQEIQTSIPFHYRYIGWVLMTVTIVEWNGSALDCSFYAYDHLKYGVLQMVLYCFHTSIKATLTPIVALPGKVRQVSIQ
jgi:hypothetical protein